MDALAYMTGTNLEEDKREEQNFGPEAEACSKQGVEVEEDGGGDQDRELFTFIVLGFIRSLSNG